MYLAFKKLKIKGKHPNKKQETSQAEAFAV